MTNLADLADLPAPDLGRHLRRRVEGDQVTLAVVELDPDQVVPEPSLVSVPTIYSPFGSRR